MIQYLIVAVLVGLLVLLALGGLTGRIRMQDGCCCPADPQRDLRMRDPVETQHVLGDEDLGRVPATAPVGRNIAEVAFSASSTLRHPATSSTTKPSCAEPPAAGMFSNAGLAPGVVADCDPPASWTMRSPKEGSAESVRAPGGPPITPGHRGTRGNALVVGPHVRSRPSIV